MNVYTYVHMDEYTDTYVYSYIQSVNVCIQINMCIHTFSL